MYPELNILDDKNGVNWQNIESLFNTQICLMKACMQEPKFHAEGDVWAHTKMVVEKLISFSEWKNLCASDKELVLLGALLHDVGKPACTVILENGERSSRGHPMKGQKLTRMILKDLVSPDKREIIAALVRLHGLPAHPEIREMDKTVIRISYTSRCDLLCLLAKADMEGRIITGESTIGKSADNIEFFAEYCRDLECFSGPKLFPSPHTRFKYFHKDMSYVPSYELYDDTTFEVIMMSGIPGVGKDYYIHHNYPDFPVLSLDELRDDMDISAIENQGRLIQAAYQKAKELLREGKPFVFNATNVTAFIRRKWIDLFYSYRASTKIVYLEPPFAVILEQNAKRIDSVPEHVIYELFGKTNTPDLTESHKLEKRT